MREKNSCVSLSVSSQTLILNELQKEFFHDDFQNKCSQKLIKKGDNSFGVQIMES